MAHAKSAESDNLFGSTSQLHLEWVDRARLLFNYLRLSPGYWFAHNYPREQRISRAMSALNRQFLTSHQRYGDVYSQTFSEWIQNRQHLFRPKVTRLPRILTGQRDYLVDADDLLIHIPAGIRLPSAQTLASLLAPYSSSEKIDPRNNDCCSIRIKSLWKMLHLAYVRLLNPDIELWRVGVLAESVERFGSSLDPWAPRRLAKDSLKRRHLTLVVNRLLERGCLVAENAALGVFPADTRREGLQLRFDFENFEYGQRLRALGKDELIHSKERIRQLTK